MVLQRLVLLILLLPVQSVFADDRPQSPSAAEARVHFDRGVELYRESNYDAALAEFTRARELAPNYKILYNLAQVQAERHEYLLAINLLMEYLSQGGSDIPADRRQVVNSDLDKLRQRVATLSIDVNVAGAEIFVNDVSRGLSPLSEPVRVNVGTVRLRVTMRGYSPASQVVTVAGGDRPHIVLTLAQESAVAATGNQTARPRNTTIKVKSYTPFWIGLGTTVVLGAVTATFGGLAVAASTDVNHELERVPARPSEVDSARSKLRTMAALTDGFGVATLVGAGASLYLLLDPPEHTEPAPVSGVRAHLAPTPTGMALAGTF